MNVGNSPGTAHRERAVIRRSDEQVSLYATAR
jgi:hypothetical protein